MPLRAGFGFGHSSGLTGSELGASCAALCLASCGKLGNRSWRVVGIPPSWAKRPDLSGVPV